MLCQIRFLRWGLLLSSGCLSLCGCEALSDRLHGDNGFLSGESTHQLEEQNRFRFQSDRDPQAFNWLLKNRLAAGMSVQAVNTVLGQDGQLLADDRWIKHNGGRFRETDRVYRWGPDSNARSVYLVFRNERLMLPNGELFWD